MAPSVLPPPPLWQSDVLANITNNPDSTRSRPGGASRGVDAVALAEAYRHIVGQRGAPDRRDAGDLYDLLANARREDTYQPYFQGWPSLLRPLSPAMADMPAMVQEKYRACATMCFCGLFPQIRHAWASIDNSLYLWRYDRSNDVPVEYCGEEQAICVVGLVTPRPGVFLEAIQHLLVLCTTTEIVLLGLCLTRGGSRPSDPLARDGGSAAPVIALQPLPMYTVPSDNVVMTCVAGTAGGRIFLGGADSQLYELQYAASDTWARKRCTKVRITGRLQQLLPSFLPAVLGYGSGAPLERVVVDDARHTLYTLTPPGHIQVFDLGPTGRDAARKVAEITDLYQAAAQATWGRDVFRNAAADRKSAAVKHITPIPPSESSKLTLLAVTADGRRVYLTTQPLRSYYGAYGGGYAPPGVIGTPGGGVADAARPTTLQAVYARQALPTTNVLGTRTAGSAAPTGPAGLEVVAAHYSHGTLLLSEASGTEGRTTALLLACRNTTQPLGSSLTPSLGAGAGAAGLRELLAQLDNVVPGETCAVEAQPAGGLLETLRAAAVSAGPGAPLVAGQHDELAAQLFAPPPRFVLISTAGVMELEKRRPLDVLAVLLEERSAARVAAFFEAYGAPEAAAMCVALACAPIGAKPAVVVEEAAACLENTPLVGEPRMPQDAVAGSVGRNGGAEIGGGAFGVPGLGSLGGASGGFYMGQAVNPNPEPDWSAAHRGLCLYASRLLAPVWELRLLARAGAGPGALLKSRLPPAALEELHGKLRALDAFLGQHLDRRQQRGAYARHAPSLPQGGLGGGYAPGLFGSTGAQEDAQGEAQASKRQRLAAAATLEDERARGVQALMDRAAQALGLLQLLAAHNLPRISAALPETQRKQLADLTLRDLVCEASGEALATHLISGLVTQQLDGGGPGAKGPGAVSGVDVVASLLQRHCPAFFKEDDRLFYQASAQLKAAEALPAESGERDGLVASALATLRRVPLAANLEQLTSQLAYLKAYKGLVAIPLAAAAALDPTGAAQRPDDPGCEAARGRRREAYRHILEALRLLSTGSGNPAAAAATAAGVPPDKAVALPAPDRTAAKAAILAASLAAQDTYFHACLYEALIELGETSTLLASGAPHLEPFLVDASGLGPGLAAAAAGQELPPIGPLTPRQVALAELLARLCVGGRRFQDAAAVHKCLAVRRAGPGGQAVAVTARLASLQAAVLQARSAGSATVVEGLEADAKLMAMQATCLERVQALAAAAAAGSGERAPGGLDLGRVEAELSARPLDASHLYNDVAQPAGAWDVCLQLVDFAGGGVPPSLVRQLWDHALLGAWEGRPAMGKCPAGLEGAAALLERLGAQFYPNQISLPLTHVVFRLVQLATGWWPVGDGSAGPPGAAAPIGAEARIARAVLAATPGSLAAALRVLELLLSRRAPDVPEQDLAHISVRLALLRALAEVCAMAQSELSSALLAPGLAGPTVGPGATMLPGALAQREAGSLADACDRYALEAKRLGTPDAMALADSFASVRRVLTARLGSAIGR